MKLYEDSAHMTQFVERFQQYIGVLGKATHKRRAVERRSLTSSSKIKQCFHSKHKIDNVHGDTTIQTNKSMSFRGHVQLYMCRAI